MEFPFFFSFPLGPPINFQLLEEFLNLLTSDKAASFEAVASFYPEKRAIFTPSARIMQS